MAQAVLDPKHLERVTDSLSSLHYRWTFIDPNTTPCDLESAIRQKMPWLDPSGIADRIKFGGTYVNGRKAPENLPLTAPCLVEYYEPKFDIAAPDGYFPKFCKDYVLYNEDGIVIVYKPPRLPTLPVKDQWGIHLKAELEKLFGNDLHMPSRLDVSAQGLVMLSIDRNLHKAVQHFFSEKQIKKYYRIQVAGAVPWLEKTLCVPIGRDPRHPILRKVVRDGGKYALTEFVRIQVTSSGKSPTTLLEVRPTTGRTHQIRIHSAYLGHPVVGDAFYMGPEASDLHLVSFRLVFIHPVSKKEVTVQIPESLCPTWAFN